MRNWDQLGAGTAKNWGERGGGNRRVGEDKEAEELSPPGAESWGNARHRVSQLRMASRRTVSNALCPCGDGSGRGAGGPRSAAETQSVEG